MARARSLGLGLAVVLVLLALPSLALGDASVSRSGDTVTLISGPGADDIGNAGTDNLHLISFDVPRGHVLRAGPGCERLTGRRIVRVIVTCGAPSRSEANPVTLVVKLGAGDDTFTAAPWDDVQPRILARGSSGDDTIYGSTNADTIEGNQGQDRLYGLDDADDIKGGDGRDLIVGGAGDDGIVGGNDRDRVYGDELRPTSAWGNDLLTESDFGVGPDLLDCGEGTDAAVVDLNDVANNCEGLGGSQFSPPADTVGTLPLTVSIGPLAPTPGGLARILRGQPIRLPVTFSAAAQITALLRVSDAEASRLGLPGNEHTLADDLGTPLTLIPLTLNTQIRLRWPVRRYLYDDNLIRAQLTIVGESVTGARTTATQDITLR